jgi:hypothetical protein
LGCQMHHMGDLDELRKKRCWKETHFVCRSTSITKNAMLFCKRLLPCWSVERNLIVAVQIIDAHNAPITTFFQSKKELTSGQQILLPKSPRPPCDRPLFFGGGSDSKGCQPASKQAVGQY